MSATAVAAERQPKTTDVPRLCPGGTVVCIGGGPSLTAEDVAFCRGRATAIAVNDAYRLAPWADVLYAADWTWWAVHSGVPSFDGLKFTVEPPPLRGVRLLRQAGYHGGLEFEPDGLRLGLDEGQSSGYQALNLAVHLGAKTIVLLGYDMERPADGPTHWFGEHPSELRRDSPYAAFRAAFDTLQEPLRALGITVVNCSRTTALTCFPRMPLAEALS